MHTYIIKKENLIYDDFHNVSKILYKDDRLVFIKNIKKNGKKVKRIVIDVPCDDKNWQMFRNYFFLKQFK